MAGMRRSKQPTLSALEEVDEADEVQNATNTSPTNRTPTGKKRLQLTIKNVLLRAQVTKVFTEKSANSIVPEPVIATNKLAPIPTSPQKPLGIIPATPPPLELNHNASASGNIWSNVVRKATLKPEGEGAIADEGGGASAANATDGQRKSTLRALLQSPKVKQYVDKVAQRSGSVRPLQQSITMRQWTKCSSTSSSALDEEPEHSDSDEDDGKTKTDAEREIEAQKREAAHPDYGRNLILAESCRAAFCRDAENRSNADIQALRTWFQKTKLKTCTDFESLQAVELTLLCRRMRLHAYYPNEVVFKQGDEGDALYIIFSGKVEVRVSQKVMGEFVEVVVCEMGKGEFFGERSLLNNEPRAATIVTKVATELVSICRDDYNVMLKQDQQAFLQKVAAQNGNNQRASQILMNNHDTYIKILKKKPSSRSKPDLATLAQFLQTLKFFRGLPKTFVQELCTIVELINVDANTTIFREGEIGKLFYVIMSGAVDVKISAVDKRGGPTQTKLVNLGEGSHFGDLALMKKDGLRSATVVSTQETELLIIAEKDYNSILKKLQKEDMKKRLHLLDRVPIFQSVEWTTELMEELSYVLTEQRYPAGSTVYKQGDKANQIFFLTRGEVLISKLLKDPKSQKERSVVVERLGPFNVFGDDAATGKHFNEVVLRSNTALANTPIEALVLSKYDVFNRLSKSTRQTLRNHTHRHLPPVVEFDQLYKTLKWDEYKRKVVASEINFARLNKILPNAAKSQSSQRKSALNEHKGKTLLEGNELLLLSPIKANSKAPPMTLAGYTMNYNPDITTQNRTELLQQVMENNADTTVKVLDEGNPMVYLDYLAPSNPALSTAVYDEIVQSSDSAMADNFIFSLPSPRKAEKKRKSPKKSKVNQPAQENSSSSNRHLQVGSSTRRISVSTPRHAQLANAHSFNIPSVSPGFVVVNFANQELIPVSPHPAFRILGQFPTYVDAVAAARKIEQHENTHAYRSCAFKPDHPVEFYILESSRHALVPKTMDNMMSRYYCDQKLYDYIQDLGHLTKWNSKHQILLEKGVKSATPPQATHEAIAGVLQEIGGFAESMHLCTPTAGSSDVNRIQNLKKTVIQLQDIEHNHMPLELKQPDNFACMSTLLPGDGSEPTFGVFGCFPTEEEATEYAEKGFPKEISDQALLCVVPMYEWIYFEDTSDWCLQMRKSQDRHHLALHKKELHAIQQPVAPVVVKSNPSLHEAPQWLLEQQQGQRLHQLITSHMGVKSNEKDSDKPEDEGYSQKNSVTLEQKLESLHDILNARHQNTTYGSSIQKMQKVQRFGHIMKLRLQKE